MPSAFPLQHRCSDTHVFLLEPGESDTDDDYSKRLLEFWGTFRPKGVKLKRMEDGRFYLEPKSYHGAYDTNKTERIMVGGPYWGHQGLNEVESALLACCLFS